MHNDMGEGTSARWPIKETERVSAFTSRFKRDWGWGDSFLGIHNLAQNRTYRLLVAVGQDAWGLRVLHPCPFLLGMGFCYLFSLGVSAVLGSFCPSLFLCLSPPKLQLHRRTDVPLQLTAAHWCSCLTVFPSLSPACLMAAWHLLPGKPEVSHRASVALLGREAGCWRSTCHSQGHQLSQSLRRQCQATLFATTF